MDYLELEIMSKYVARRLRMSLSHHSYDFIGKRGGHTPYLVHAKTWSNKGAAEIYLIKRKINTQYQVVRIGPATDYHTPRLI